MGKFSFDDAPGVAEYEVIDKLRESVAVDEFLFYRSGVDENDWLFGGMGEVWECQCTACGGELHRREEPQEAAEGLDKLPALRGDGHAEALAGPRGAGQTGAELSDIPARRGFGDLDARVSNHPRP